MPNFSKDTSCSGSAVDITLSPSAVYDPPFRGFYVGQDGNLAVRMAEGQQTVTFTAVKAGTVYPLSCDMFLVAGSTAFAAGIIKGLR